MNGISRETYEQMDDNSRLLVLFDYASESHRCACDTQERLERLESKVERRKKFDTTVSGVAGLVGGFIAVLGSAIWRK